MSLIIGLSILGILGAIIAGMSGGGNSKNANSDRKMSDSIDSGSKERCKLFEHDEQYRSAIPEPQS